MLGGHEPGHADSGGELFTAALDIAQRSAPFLLAALGLTLWLGPRAQQELQKLGKSLPVTLFGQLGFALGAEGLALGLASYGIAWTLAAFAATTFVPAVAAAVAMLAIAIAGEEAAKASAERLALLPVPPYDRLRRFDRITAIWVVAVAVAAVFQTALSDASLYGSLAGGTELVVAGVLGSLLGTGGSSVVALAALTEKGLSPGAALLAVALSSALGAGVLVKLWRALGQRGFVPVLIWMVCLTAVLGVGLNQVAPVARPLQFPASVGRACAGILLLLIVLRAGHVGVRRWLAGWLSETAPHHHRHHDHHHAHFHSSEMPNGSAATTRSPDASGPSAEA
jgi:hypothetical protein